MFHSLPELFIANLIGHVLVCRCQMISATGNKAFKRPGRIDIAVFLHLPSSYTCKSRDQHATVFITGNICGVHLSITAPRDSCDWKMTNERIKTWLTSKLTTQSLGRQFVVVSTVRDRLGKAFSFQSVKNKMNKIANALFAKVCSSHS